MQDTIHSAIESLAEISWKFLDGPQVTVEEMALKIFSNPRISSFLINTSRLAVFSKELAKSFRADLDSLALIKQLKYFYNQPTAGVLQQLTDLVSRYIV